MSPCCDSTEIQQDFHAFRLAVLVISCIGGVVIRRPHMRQANVA
jgi:hypothetical protein